MIPLRDKEVNRRRELNRKYEGTFRLARNLLKPCRPKRLLRRITDNNKPAPKPRITGNTKNKLTPDTYNTAKAISSKTRPTAR